MLSFNENTSLILPFIQLIPDDSETLLEPLDRLQPGGNYSNSAAAVERAIEEFATSSQRDANKSIVIIADAQINTGDPPQDRQFSNWMRELLSPETAAAGIRAYSIAYSKTKDVQDIEILAQTTGGRYVRVDNASDLRASLESVAENITTRHTFDDISSMALDTEATPKPEKTVSNETNPDEVSPPERTQNSARPFSENLQREGGSQSQSSANITGSSSIAIQLKALMSKLPAAEQLTAWIASNKMLQAALLATILFVGLGFILLLKFRKRSTNRSWRRESQAGSIPPAQLEDLNGISDQHVYDISGKFTWIRRAPAESSDNVQNVIINDHLISRDHALIEYEEGGYWISDRDSANGTYVNDQRITSKKLLKYGDRIRFAKHEFKFAQPPQLAMSETVASTPLSDGAQASLSEPTYPTGIPSLSARDDSSWDQPTIKPDEVTRSPRGESFGKPYHEQGVATHTAGPRYETAPSHPTYHRGLTSTGYGEDESMENKAGQDEQDHEDSTTASTFNRGGTDKLPEYHQGDTIMFQRHGQHTGKEKANHIDPTQLSGNGGDALEAEGEQQTDYQRGGTQLYRQPDRQTSDLMSTSRNVFETTSPSRSTHENAQDYTLSSNPQIKHSDTVAISREQMQRILSEDKRTTRSPEIPAVPTPGRTTTKSSSDELSPPDQVKTAYHPTGESLRPGSRKHLDKEDWSEANVKAPDSKGAEPSSTAPDQHKDTVLIPQKEMQRMMGLFSQPTVKPRSASTAIDRKSSNISAEIEEHAESDRHSVSKTRDERIEPKSADHASPEAISDEWRPVGGEPADSEMASSTVKQSASSFRDKTLAIPTEEIEKMVRSTEWDGSLSAPYPVQASPQEKSSSVVGDDDTEEFWLDSMNENSEESASGESFRNDKLGRPTNVGESGTDVLPLSSPNKMPRDHRATSEPTLRTQSTQDDADKTQIIPHGDPTTYLGPKAHPQITDDDDDDKTRQWPRHRD
jgi:pSer/pThr/pTyr-binding forkhead associated (FHA) protein